MDHEAITECETVLASRHEACRRPGSQAAGCAILGPSAALAVLCADLPFGDPGLLGHSEHADSERSLTTWQSGLNEAAELLEGEK